MSGPITAGYFLFYGTLLLAQRALVEAKAMKREYGEVLGQLRARDEELARARQGQQVARLERVVAVRREAARQAARHERLRALAQTLGAQSPDLEQRIPAPAPPSPVIDDDATWSEHLRALESAVRELETLLAQTSSASSEQLRAALGSSSSAPTIDDVLSAYALQRQLKPGLDPSQADRFRQTAARVLQRLELGDGETLPSHLESLAREIVLAPSLERAEALTSELRLAVQRHSEASNAQRRDADIARSLLAELPDDVPETLRRAIERVAAGVEPMDDALRESAQAALDAAAAERQIVEQQAAADVLEQSLRDLGYDVQDIEATLFVDGGTVHFRRDGWEDYYVRLRVDPRERTVNFNVVRASGGEDSAERRRLDALAEDRWCAEFPRLLQTLAARGLALDVTRRLDAGEVPVQQVDAGTLPRMRAADDDSAAPRRAPMARRSP